jgi:esterase
MKLHYRIIGEGNPVLLLHGLFGMSDNLQSFGRQLAEKNHQVLIVDLRNHGQSPHDEIHSYQVMADDIVELMQDLNLNKVDIIGHSMGGKVVLKLLNSYAEKINKAVVIDIAPWSYPVHHREILDALLSIDLNINRTRKDVERALSEKIKDQGTLFFLLKNLYWQSPDQLAWRFNLKILNQQIESIGADTWPDQIISTPILFIRGEKSNYIDPYRMNEITKWFPQADLTEIKNSGHWVHAEQPAALLAVVGEYLS